MWCLRMKTAMSKALIPAAVLALLAAGKVVGETMSDARQRRLVEEFLSGSGVGGSNN